MWRASILSRAKCRHRKPSVEGAVWEQKMSLPSFLMTITSNSLRWVRSDTVQLCRLALCSTSCEGSRDVVSVLTLLVGGVAQAFHDDRVVEPRVQLGVEEVEGKDREEQVEVERDKRVKEGAP